MKLGRPWKEKVESLWDNQTFYSKTMLSHLLYCLSLYMDFCARHEKTHPPVFTCTGRISSEWLDVLTRSAQKVFFLISWVVQSNRMLQGFCSLMYLPLALCIKKYGVVYATIFLNCLALMWKNLSLRNAAPCCGIESGVCLEILFLFEVGIILLQTNFQHSCIYFYVPL